MKHYKEITFIIRTVTPSTAVQINKESDEMICNI